MQKKSISHMNVNENNKTMKMYGEWVFVTFMTTVTCMSSIVILITNTFEGSHHTKTLPMNPSGSVQKQFIWFACCRSCYASQPPSCVSIRTIIRASIIKVIVNKLGLSGTLGIPLQFQKQIRISSIVASCTPQTIAFLLLVVLV